MNEFEQKLSRQPLKKIPSEWRAEILREERRVAVREIGDADTASLPKWNWRTALAEIFWPNQKVWAGLAAIWIFIFVLNFSMRDKSPVIAEKVSPPSPEVIAELKQQKLLFAELIGANETRVADRQKLFLPKPRSECVEILTA
jgi:hypothetical protein